MPFFKISTILLACLLTFSSSVWASPLYLKAGLGLGPSLVENEWSANATGPSLMLSTHVGTNLAQIGLKHLEDFDFTLSSFTTFTAYSNLMLSVDQSKILADAWNFTFALGPTIKWKIPVGPAWQKRPYLYAGPLIALHSIYTRHDGEAEVVGGQYQIGQKITFEASGLILGIGMETMAAALDLPNPEKPSESNNFYYEITLKYLKSYRVKSIGGTFRKPTVVSRQDISSDDFNEWAVHFTFGSTFF